MKTSDFEDILTIRSGSPASVAVAISLYNYESFIEETLESVAAQDQRPLDLVVVDDRSRDGSVRVATDWVTRNPARFGIARVLRHRANSGLSATRNTAFSATDNPFVFVLDADNAIYPRCVSRCLEAIQAAEAAFAYPIIEKFGDQAGLMGFELWDRTLLAHGNYIDAMALVRKSAWLTCGGYDVIPYGWEDYDLWCKAAELGLKGVQVPEILARYRVHRSSMLRTQTNPNAQKLIAFIRNRHPWLQI